MEAEMLRVSIFNVLPGGADAADLRTTLWIARL